MTQKLNGEEIQGVISANNGYLNKFGHSIVAINEILRTIIFSFHFIDVTLDVALLDNSIKSKETGN